jgi:hypothetical protein
LPDQGIRNLSDELTIFGATLSMEHGCVSGVYS